MPSARKTIVHAMLLTFLIGNIAAAAYSNPTPVPGGANEQSGVEGPLQQTLFNGVLRLRSMSLRDEVPGGKTHANSPGDRPIVFRAIVSNGLHDSTHGYFNATLADANGITVSGQVLDDGWDLARGAAARTAIGFSVPPDFVPTKIVLAIAAMPKARAFRVTLRPADLPAQAPAMATPQP